MLSSGGDKELQPGGRHVSESKQHGIVTLDWTQSMGKVLETLYLWFLLPHFTSLLYTPNSTGQ